MVGLSDADQNQLPLPRLDFSRAAGARYHAVYGPRAARRYARRAGMALLLFQGADDGPRPLSGARYFHPVDETEKYASLDEGRAIDHASRPRILRLRQHDARSRNRRDAVHWQASRQA